MRFRFFCQFVLLGLSIAVFFIQHFSPSLVRAAAWDSPCDIYQHGVKANQPYLDTISFNDGEQSELSFSIDTTGLGYSDGSPGINPNKIRDPKIVIQWNRTTAWLTLASIDITNVSSDLPITLNAALNPDLFKLISPYETDQSFSSFGERHVFLSEGNNSFKCKIGKYKIMDLEQTCNATVTFEQARKGETCYSQNGNSCMEVGTPVTIKVQGRFTDNGVGQTNKDVSLIVNNNYYDSKTDNEGNFNITQPFEGGYFSQKEHSIIVNAWNVFHSQGVQCALVNQTFQMNCATSCKSTLPSTSSPSEPTKFSLCSQLKKDSPEEASCEKCLGQNGVWTAIGCISAEPEEMIAHFIRLGIGLGGGVALLMTLIGGFLMTTSQGNPKQQEQAKEMITSAVIGLLFVLFSVVLLQFIGVTILQIPGFGGPSTAGTS